MLKRIIQKTTLLSCVLFAAFNCKAQSDHWETVVYDNSTWSYIIPTAATPINWISPSFDASTWNTGPGGFGFGDSDDNTALPNGTISVYQRITFNIVDVSLLTKAIFNMDYDDGFVAYLNGVEIARNGLSGTGQPSYNQLASISHEAVLYCSISESSKCSSSHTNQYHATITYPGRKYSCYYRSSSIYCHTDYHYERIS